MLNNHFIKNLQSKPESFRRAIMWFGVFFVMTAIFIFWLMTFPSQISVTANNAATENIKNELPGIWQSMKEQVNNLMKLNN